MDRPPCFAWIKAEAPKRAIRHCILHFLPLTASLKNTLDGAIKIMLLNLSPHGHIFLSLGGVHTAFLLRAEALARLFKLGSELATVLVERGFYLKEWLTIKLPLFRPKYFINIFSKNERSKPVISGKQLTVICCQWSNSSSQVKIRIWETCVHHCELDSFLILKDLPHEFSGDSNKHDFLYCIMKSLNI